MSRKSFLIWGLVVISVSVMLAAIIQYLAFSKIIDPKALGVNLYALVSYAGIISFATILIIRLKGISWRKKGAALCISAPLYIVFTILGALLASGYVMLDVFGAHDRFFDAIPEWTKLSEPKSATPWTVMERIEYVLFWVPGFYLMNLGLFALLAFGSLDPRTPSKNRVVQFLKTGFLRKADSAVQTNFTEAAHG